MEHIRETAYWAGRLIGHEQAWEVAEEIIEAIKYAETQAFQQPTVSESVCPKCGCNKLTDLAGEGKSCANAYCDWQTVR